MRGESKTTTPLRDMATRWKKAGERWPTWKHWCIWTILCALLGAGSLGLHFALRSDPAGLWLVLGIFFLIPAAVGAVGTLWWLEEHRLRRR